MNLSPPLFRPLLLASLLCLPAAATHAAPVGAFSATTLVTNATDPDLVNPWGLSSSPTSPFWVSDNATGKATLYNSLGAKQGLVVSLPSGSEQVTGQVFNGTSSFHGDNFLFATENGTINGWRGALGTTAETLFVRNQSQFTGLAISTDKTRLYAANFAQGTIDLFDSGGFVRTFTDPTMPSGYVPFNIQNLDGSFYVTYALRSGATAQAGAGHGFVAAFNPVSGTFTRLVTQGVLDSPWGLALAPVGFGALGGDLLVGNSGDGLINAFDPITGDLVGTLADAALNPLVEDGLWGLGFGNGGNGGSTASLYITAGPNHGAGGLFARIDALPPGTGGPQVPEPASAALALLALALLGATPLRHTAARAMASPSASKATDEGSGTEGRVSPAGATSA
jgi:uncharacterized protein (TIGR03118 family)